MRLLHRFSPGFEALRNGHKLEHTGRQIADRACYGSAPKAQFHLLSYSLIFTYSGCFPFWLYG